MTIRASTESRNIGVGTLGRGRLTNGSVAKEVRCRYLKVSGNVGFGCRGVAMD
jgi:hypothetical protein